MSSDTKVIEDVKKLDEQNHQQDEQTEADAVAETTIKKEDVEKQTFQPDVIVVAGGAVKGLSLLGALHYAEEENYLQNIHTMAGTSVGALIVYLLAIGYKPIEFLTRIISHRMIERLNASMNVTSILGEEGVLAYSQIQEVLEKMTVDKIGYFPTIKDIFTKFNKRLVITTFNLTKDAIEYITPETHPDLPCLTALRMSSNIPFLFDQFKYMGCYYVDGGIADNFPVDQALKYGKKVLGFYTITSASSPATTPGDGIFQYVLNLLMVLPRIRLNEVISSKSPDSCLFVKIYDDMPGLNFNLSIHQKLDLFSLGYNSAKKCLDGDADEVVADVK